MLNVEAKTALEKSLEPLVVGEFYDRTDAKDYIGWAAKTLEAGFDSASLRVLSGLSLPIENDEVVLYFKRSLDELELVLPPLAYSLYAEIRLIAEAFEAGTITAEEACTQLSDWYYKLWPKALAVFWLLEIDYLENDELVGSRRAEFVVLMQTEIRTLLADPDAVILSITDALRDEYGMK